MERLLNRNQSALIALTLFLVCFGAYQLLKLPISLYPNTSKPIVKVEIFFKDDVEQFMDFWGGKIATSMKTIKDVELVEGEYDQGKATYYVHFKWKKDNDAALRDVSSIGAFYQAQLSRELPPIKVGFYNPGSECYVVVKSNKLSAEALSQELNNSLLPVLNEIDGVDRSWVSLLGEEHLVVKIDPLKAAEYQLPVDNIVKTLRSREFDSALGDISTEFDGKIAIRVKKRVTSIAQLEAITVAQLSGRDIKLKDVATVVISKTELNRVLQLDGQTAVAVAVWPKPDANLYAVAQNFLKQTHAYTANIGSVFVLNDPSTFINEAIMTVVYAILTGMLIASVSVLLFFRSVSKTIMVCLAMPLSLLGAGAVMQILGVGINLLSLGAMSVSIGMVIDGAIVVIDNIDHHQRNSRNKPLQVYVAVSEVAPSVFASILTTIIVFLPMSFTVPIASSLLSDIALIVVAIMVFSLFITLIFIPTLFSFVTPNACPKPAHKFNPVEFMIQIISDSYCFLLKGLLSYRPLQLLFAALVVALFWLSTDYFPHIKRELIAQPQASIIDVIVTFKKDGLEIEDRINLVEQIRSQVLAAYEVDIKFAYSDIRKQTGYISLHLKDYRVFERVYRGLQAQLINTDEVDLEVEPWITSALAVPNYPDLRLLVTGETEEKRRSQLDELNILLKDKKQVSKIKITPKPQFVQKFELSYKEQILAQLFSDQNIDTIKQQISEYAGMAIEEKYLSEFELHGKQSKLYAQLGNVTLQDSVDIGNLPFFINNRIYHLRDVIDIQSRENWKIYYSRNSAPIYMAEIWLKGETHTEKDDVLAPLYLHYESSGEIPFILGEPKQEVNEGIESLFKAVFLAFVLVFLVVLFLFSRFYLAVIICAAIPFGIAGAVIALYLFNSTLSLNSLLGMIMLCGISVNNSIIFVDLYQRIKDQHSSVVSALVQAGRQRFRAIMVTNLTTIAGLLPLAIGFGASGQILQPLGISVAFGIIVSTFFTILCIPLMVCLVEFRHFEVSQFGVSQQQEKIIMKGID